MIKAIKNRIFVKKDKMPEKIGSIYIPENDTNSYSPPYSGIIISVGSEVTDPDLCIGARILFHDLAGTEFTINDQVILSIMDVDVLAVIDKDLVII